MALLGDDPVATIVDAIARIDRDLVAVPSDPALRKNWTDAMGERLNQIGAKIAPHLSVEQGDAWRSAMAEALSDLPATVALTAVKRAIHKPFRFISDVESVVRGIAAEIVEGRQRAATRLRWLHEELARAAKTDAILPPPEPKADIPLTLREIGALMPELRRIGLSQGWITQAEVDAALAMRRDMIAAE